MLDWQALLKKTGAINFRVGSARRVKKIAIISCGFKKPCYDGRLCWKSRTSKPLGNNVLAVEKVENYLTRTKNPVYNLRLSWFQRTATTAA